MKTIFEKKTRDELIERIGTLNDKSSSQWGKMNIYQMLKHCTLCEEMYLGKAKYKRVFIGYIFGKIGLRNLLKDETPLKRNAPTSSAFKISEINGDVSLEREKWISLVREYENFNNNDFVHWFFGKMSKEQVGYFVYKHTDHHLRQFNA
jgi:uncharacterized protein DUF1569